MREKDKTNFKINKVSYTKNKFKKKQLIENFIQILPVTKYELNSVGSNDSSITYCEF